MIALSYSIIILIGFICLIAARSTVEGKLGSPEAKHKGLQLLLENLSPEQSRQYDRFGYFDVLGSRTGKRYRICHGTSRNVNELVRRTG